jgi:hypothetical protein
MGSKKFKGRVWLWSSKGSDNAPGPASVKPDATLPQRTEAKASGPADNQAARAQPAGEQGEQSSPAPKDIDTPICELWSLAYQKLREEDEDLIVDYEAKLTGNLAAGLGSALKVGTRERMETILRRKMDEVNRDAWKLKFGSSEVQVKDLVQPVLGVVDWANDYITGAVSANPYASTAWAGVSLILPVS